MKTHLTEADHCPECDGYGDESQLHPLTGFSTEPCPHCNGTGYDPEKVEVEALAKACTEFRTLHKAAVVVEWKNADGLIGLRVQDDAMYLEHGGSMTFVPFIKQENEG